MRRLLDVDFVAPVLTGVGGGLGIWVARENLGSGPAIVAVALALATFAVVFGQRGVALGALGVATAAAFVSPDGLGPLLVATGVIVSASPAAIDRRLAAWPELVDGLLCLPALAGLASVVAAQPSVRGVAVGAGTGVLCVLSWWRGPRQGLREPQRESVVSYLAAVGALLLVGAPELFGVLGVLPDATATAGRGLVAAIGVFALAMLVPQLRKQQQLAPRLPEKQSDSANRA